MKPEASEYPPYYKYYIDLIDSGNLIHELSVTGDRILDSIKNISEEKAGFRYQPDKWSVKELMQHVIDTERIFSYRSLCFARGEKQELPGFDENTYASGSLADRLPFTSIVNDFDVVRKSTIILFQSFGDEQLLGTGRSGSNIVSVRALGFMIAGHAVHHVNILRKLYF